MVEFLQDRSWTCFLFHTSEGEVEGLMGMKKMMDETGSGFERRRNRRPLWTIHDGAVAAEQIVVSKNTCFAGFRFGTINQQSDKWLSPRFGLDSLFPYRSFSLSPFVAFFPSEKLVIDLSAAPSLFCILV